MHTHKHSREKCREEPVYVIRNGIDLYSEVWIKTHKHLTGSFDYVWIEDHDSKYRVSDKKAKGAESVQTGVVLTGNEVWLISLDVVSTNMQRHQDDPVLITAGIRKPRMVLLTLNVTVPHNWPYNIVTMAACTEGNYRTPTCGSIR